MPIKNIKGMSKKEFLIYNNQEFKQCKSGIPLHRFLLTILFIYFVSLCTGIFYSFTITQTIVSLIGGNLELSSISLLLAFLLFVFPIFILTTTFFYILNLSISNRINTLIIFFFNTLGILYGNMSLSSKIDPYIPSLLCLLLIHIISIIISEKAWKESAYFSVGDIRYYFFDF